MLMHKISTRVAVADPDFQIRGGGGGGGVIQLGDKGGGGARLQKIFFGHMGAPPPKPGKSALGTRLLSLV